jgi:hypothetical protein
METQTRSPLAQTHHQPKEEISIWHKTGNFYFGLTDTAAPDQVMK